jgi:hypothetical protein
MQDIHVWEDDENAVKFLNNNDSDSNNKSPAVAEVVPLSGFWPPGSGSTG